MFTAGRTLLSKTTKNTSMRLIHTIPTLPYEYNDLEPIISAEIMELHHLKHHAAYVANLNLAEDKLKVAVSKNAVHEQISAISAIKFNGGGHINHSIFWKNLTPKQCKPKDVLCQQIEKDFGSMDNMKKYLSECTIAIQGSGWGWLAYDRLQRALRIATCSNQDPLQATTGLIPLLGIDVWEHAYYLQYKNVRANYVNAIFDIVNWDDVSTRFINASKF